MFGQLFAIAAALGLTYGLLRLRHFILTYGKSHRRTFRVQFLQLKGREVEPTIEEWPREIELAPLALTQRQPSHRKQFELLGIALLLVGNLFIASVTGAQAQSVGRFSGSMPLPTPTATPTPTPTPRVYGRFGSAKLYTTEEKKSSEEGVATPFPPSDKKVETSVAEELKQMREVIERLQTRVDELEAQNRAAKAPLAENKSINDAVTGVSSVAAGSNLKTSAQTDKAAAQAEADRAVLDFFRGTTINMTLDGYYGYNFNRPVGRVNLLRAYDVSSNSFSLNQAAVVIERAPDVEAGRRFGGRLDLQYGQATETVQGNAANEPRPQTYRNVWQAYGTYVAPLGKGLTVDFGKFAGSLGYETNYTKDNFNYSRAYFFNYLPFYHFGFRASYPVNDKLTATYWLVNGANQSEDFNGFKSQAVLLTIKPSSRVTLQTNYYAGQEQRDVNPALNPGFAPLPTQPGLSTDVIRPTPDGRFHVLDAYGTFNVTDKLTLALEGDYVINRTFKQSAPARVWGGAAYARYQFTPKFSLGGRFEYLADRGGLFSGVTQDLKEHTVTAEYKFGEGFLGRLEYRRDYSNQPFFLTNTPGLLKKEQNTATLGLVWWFGRKEGSW